MDWLSVLVILYGLGILAGGVLGYAIAKSVPSIASGIIFGALLIGSAALAKTNAKVGYGIAAVASLLLCGVFVLRYIQTHKVMPNLMLLAMSAVMFLILIVSQFAIKAR